MWYFWCGIIYFALAYFSKIGETKTPIMFTIVLIICAITWPFSMFMDIVIMIRQKKRE
jgi:hypothetical protein